MLAGLVIALAIGGYFLITAWMKPPTQPDPEEGRAVVEAFLSGVRDGKAGEAWDATTVEFKSIEGRESFIRKAKSTVLLKESLLFNSTQSVKVQDSPRTEFLFQSPASGKTVRVLVGYEGGAWKVDRLTL
jgi:hypothetical protein